MGFFKAQITHTRPSFLPFFGKVFNAVSHGASGALIYTDPAQFAPEGTQNTFPQSWWLPDSGTQRGASMGKTGPGDPLTPGFPSIDGIYRQPINDSGLPTIPAFGLSYGDAQEILHRMKGKYHMAVSSFFFLWGENLNYKEP